eukprot:TRINITY_DN57004_c0_g1_i1.p1 TRINITY_DN57004_c0_g1~~TRINITY_DN57004_c0_g1_i1.p1  ORF type:complete len:327 (-),score=61.46 TRINITY_DN57004_c0_g1_i1:116-1012(-)
MVPRGGSIVAAAAAGRLELGSECLRSGRGRLCFTQRCGRRAGGLAAAPSDRSSVARGRFRGQAPQRQHIGTWSRAVSSAAPSAAAACAGSATASASGSASSVAEGDVEDRQPLSPYEILGVPRNATAEQVREQFVRLTKELHPDNKHGRLEVNGIRFQEVQEAWFVLGDADRRREFDEFGTLAAPPSKMSPLMWAKMRISKPEEGTLMPNWGTEEPPLWLIVVAPFSVLALSVAYSMSGDYKNMAGDNALLRAGGWPCPECLIVNEASQTRCSKCGEATRETLPLNVPGALPTTLRPE